ncbi:MAG: YihY/virulence factor BrkB family protein [Bacillota bacterium]|nr:YihY/virulence factor BrkB family protein [Bacillota bacterium]
MTRKRAKEIGLNVWERLSKPYYQGAAAQLAFFFLMSMVPLFILLSQILGLFSVSAGVLSDILSRYLSEELFSTIGEYLVYRPSGTFTVVMVACALWAASKAHFALIGVANYTYTGLTRGRGYLWERFRSMGNTVLVLLLLTFSLVVLVYGNLILEMIDMYLVRFLHLEAGLDRVWYLLRWPLGLAAYFFVITYILYTLPSEKLPFRKILPGSLLTSAGMSLVTFFYSIYINHSTGRDILYGSLASIILLLIWFYFICYVLVVGIVFNAAWHESEEFASSEKNRKKFI